MKKHEVDAAIGGLLPARRADPKDTQVLMKLGALYARAARRRRQALLAYDKVLEVDARHAKALEKRAYMLDTLGRHQEAIEALQSLVAVRPKRYAAWRRLAGRQQSPHL